MNSLLAFILAEIVKQAPVLAIEIVQVFTKPAVTDEDWERLKARYAGKTYEEYLANAAQARSGATARGVGKPS
jgi:hypothetical protein